MKIALIGYGKMGRTVERIAQERGHHVVLIVDVHNQAELTTENLKKADIAIEFTVPASAPENYRKCFRASVPVVSGTTGWLSKKAEVIKEVKRYDGTLFYASNFSLGMNIFFALNRKLASLMTDRMEYRVSITEVHHTAKLDAPSGTAITLAEDLIDILPGLDSWTMENTGRQGQLKIESIREGQVPGVHRVEFDSAVDRVLIEHTAKNRDGLAFGAVLAAEFTLGKKGLLTMSNLLNGQSHEQSPNQ